MHGAFSEFYRDIISPMQIVALSKNDLSLVPEFCKEYNLDFDDSYQFCAAKKFKLIVVTMDRDFEKINNGKIIFL